MTEHTWFYCAQCDRWSVVCGKCGNNACNGAIGEVFGPIPGEMVKCDACQSAYELDQLGETND